MHKLLIVAIAMIAVLAVIGLPADAAYKFGSAPGSSIAVGGDGGSANQADVFGDVVASYTSNLGSDTAFRTNQGSNPTASVIAVFGDTASAIGSVSTTLAPGGIGTFTLSITNWSNQSDSINISVDSGNVTGPSKDSVTIKINGAIIYQNGVDTYPAATSGNLAAGAETQVTVRIEHDTNGALGLATAVIKTRPKGGAGGDTGGYIGNNGDNYAGNGNDSVTFSVNVKDIKILMLVERDTPLAPASYNGPAGDTIPGATLTYTIRYDNDGNDTGVDFRLTVKIPQFTMLATGIDSPAAAANLSPHTGATATVSVTDTAGVVVAVTDPAAALIKWTFSTGVSPNNGDANGVVDAASSDVDAGFVKFKVYIK